MLNTSINTKYSEQYRVGQRSTTFCCFGRIAPEICQTVHVWNQDALGCQKNNTEDIKAIVDQQFAVGKQILAAGLCSILEPEGDITSPDKQAIEDVLEVELLKGLDALSDYQNVMIKLSLPIQVNLYRELIAYPRCVRVVALSGGYEREEANQILAQI